MAPISLVIFLMATTLCLSVAHAQEKCVLDEPHEVLARVKARHPVIRALEFDVKAEEAAIQKARQRPNPELELEGGVGDSLEGTIQTFSGSVKHVVELGGKREKRENLAKSRARVVGIESQLQTADVLIDTVKSLYRLRQVNELIPRYREAVGAFSKIHKNLKERGRSPQEQVERETLELAMSDYRLAISSLETEKLRLEAHIAFFVGDDCQIKETAYPHYFRPRKISSLGLKDASNALSVLSEKERKQMALASLRHQDSLAIPNLKIGPFGEFERESLSNTWAVGIALEMELPFLNTNQGGKMEALRRFEAQRIREKSATTEAYIDFVAWANTYRKYVNALKSSASMEAIERKHQRVERFFQRGIIDASLAIETHRQLLSFINTRYNFELGAIEALWNLYKLDGSIAERTF